MIDKELAFKGVKDKKENTSTTSLKFKNDVIEFFDKPEFKDKVMVEVGTNNGESARIFSFLFKEVHTINIFDSAYAKELNKDRTNIFYYQFDAYSTFPWPIEIGDVFFVDAVHTEQAVKSDVYNCLRMTSSGKKYFVFDDYGLQTKGTAVNKGIDDLIDDGVFEIVTRIGEPAGYSYKNNSQLFDSEGLICRTHE